MKKFTLSRIAATPWLNRLLAGVLVVFALFGMVKIYASGAKAMSTISTAEKKLMSQSYDLDALEEGETENNTEYGKYSLLNSALLLDSDGNEIVESEAWYNLIGGRTTAHNTRYLSDCLVADPDAAEQYNPLTGIRRSDDCVKTVSTTLNSTLQEQIYAYLSEHDLTASVLITEAASGATLAAVSAPSAFYTDTNAESDALINKNFYKLSPGSTQKVATLLVIAAAGGDLTTPFECTGEYTASDGEVIKDSGVHGAVDAAGAVANSCNCWFADRISQLDNNKVIELFEAMGYLVNEENALTNIDGVPRSVSSLSINTMMWNYSSIWNILGEAEAMVSPFDMTAIIATIETSGESQQAHVVAGAETAAVTDGWAEELKAALPTVREIMHTAYDTSYVQRGFPEEIAIAKTGTTEYDSTGLNTGRRLVGCTKSGYAFYIAVENYKVNGEVTTDLTIEQIANDVMTMLDGAVS